MKYMYHHRVAMEMSINDSLVKWFYFHAKSFNYSVYYTTDISNTQDPQLLHTF